MLSRLGLENLSAQDRQNRPYPAGAPVFGKVWVLILLIGAVLTMVKWDSIATGPTGDDAIAVIRVVQRDLVEAHSSHGKSHAPILYGANVTLDEAWSKLQEKSYAEVYFSGAQSETVTRNSSQVRLGSGEFRSASGSPRYSSRTSGRISVSSLIGCLMRTTLSLFPRAGELLFSRP